MTLNFPRCPTYYLSTIVDDVDEVVIFNVFLSNWRTAEGTFQLKSICWDITTFYVTNETVELTKKTWYKL